MSRTVAYSYYTGQYHGSAVAEGEWDHAALLASARLDQIKALATVTPFGDEDECESMAICAMAEALQAWQEASATDGSGGARSESIGSVSVSYATAQELMPKGLAHELMSAVAPWLHVCLVVV